jgi:hypothetical protein
MPKPVLRRAPRGCSRKKKQKKKTDAGGSGSTAKEEFGAAYKKEYGGGRKQSDREFDVITTWIVIEFCEYMVPRLMTEKLDWKREDIHNLPEAVDEKLK